MKPHHAYYFRLPYSGEECLLENRPPDFGASTHGILITDAHGEIQLAKLHGEKFDLVK